MTRKSVKFSAALRRTPWKSNVGRREADDKNVSRSIFISSSYAERWSNLRVKFRFGSDSELVDYLLTLGESQPKPRYLLWRIKYNFLFTNKVELCTYD